MSVITPKLLIQKVDALAEAIGSTIKTLRANIGTMSSLATANKNSLVEAVNEVRTLAAGKSSLTLPQVQTGIIKDNAKAANTTYSSNKIEAYVTSQITTATQNIKTSILGGASDAYDTLKELQDAIEQDKTATSGMLDTINNRLRIDAKMTLTDEQKGFVAESLGFTDADFVETFNRALGATSNVVTGAGSGAIGD